MRTGISGSLALGVRPEHVTLSTMPARLRGRVFGAEYLGTTQIVTLDIEHGQIKARLPASIAVRLGEPVGLAFQPQRLVAVRRDDADARSAARLYEGGAPWLKSSFDSVTKRFGDIEAVRDLSLDIANGEFVVLLGPTGAGKTTTLRLIAGLE